ncbi:hypothetical protein [Pseudomonas sp. 10-1B]|uniref:hypothetical protein n=1 Tax=Pseudomonas sp. 10-1B TaxID=1546029 RepID=UPI000A5D6246|nr:hypothetical protein [Pseudomonas sp. 10-1B]
MSAEKTAAWRPQFIWLANHARAAAHALPPDFQLAKILQMTSQPPFEFHERSPLLFRLVTFVTCLCSAVLGLLSAYWLGSDVFPLLGRMLKNAPIVLTPYLGFTLIAMCTVSPILIVSLAYACWRGHKFDPPRDSRLFRFQYHSYKLTLWSIIYLAPALAILVTLGLWAKGYTPCQKLLISGSAWKVYWVNDVRYCFKPDLYTSDGQPCKRIGNRILCMQADGR